MSSSRSTNAGPVDWDAETYDRVSDPQFEWGREVLERLELNGDETVLDAGCGSGRVTAELLERLPKGRLIALDASPAMVDKARDALGDSVEYAVMDLAELELSEQVDVVFSTATFHWVPDHDNLFRRVRACLKPAGRLHAQCGGAGNVAEHTKAIAAVGARPEFAEHFETMPVMWNFSGAEATEERLGEAGFAEARAWLQPKPVTPSDPREFIRTVTIGPHLARLPEELGDPFLDAVVAEMPEPVMLDYVRLNMEARA
ncbi:MAG: class I SAM-dependent methyltransferase [Solirubrobacterales bacterium]